MPERLNENQILIRDGHVQLKPSPRSRRAYLYANSFELMLAGQALLTALIFFTTRLPTSVLGEVSPTLGYIWNALYALAGLTIVIGMVRLSVQLEAAGLVVLVSAATINVLAVVIVGPSWEYVASYALIVGGCLARLRVLVRIAKVTERAAKAWRERERQHDELQ